MKYFLAPHDDDHCLFGAFTCMREHPTVVVITDSFIQPARGEVGCSALERAVETAASCGVLGCEVIRFGLHDDTVTEGEIATKLRGLSDVEAVIVPALQGGNIHHDMTYRAAYLAFPPEKIIHYTTYTKTELYTKGDTEIIPTEEELLKKKFAMECHQSQLRVNEPHFTAVLGKSEWFILSPAQEKKVYLGAGSHRIPGWIHLDAYPFEGIDVVCDVTAGLPFEDNSVDEIYSQDFLEHLPPESKIPVMNEIWRVLKKGGTMEHIVPQAGSQNDFGSPSHLSHWTQQQFEHFDVNSYRYEKDRYYEGFKGGFELVLSQLAENGQTFHVIYKAVK